MSKRWMTWSLLGAIAAAGLGFVGARAMATGAPQLSPLTYGGVLTDKDGKPYPAAQEVVIKFYDKVDATAAKCVAPAALAEAGTGRFSVVLPGECAQAVRDTPDLWSEATVGGGKTVLPRVHVGAVPYALEADSAKVAGSAAAATGALKVAMDGVAADIAGLKKAPAGGGAPKVVDGSGVVLGTLTDVSEAFFAVLTSEGYALWVNSKGDAHPGNFIPHFLTGDCTGQPQRILTSNYVAVSTGRMLYPTWEWPNSGAAYVDATQANGAATSSIVIPKSYFSNGKCSPGNGTSFQAYGMKKLTGTEAGLPDKITGPLKIVP